MRKRQYDGLGASCPTDGGVTADAAGSAGKAHADGPTSEFIQAYGGLLRQRAYLTLGRNSAMVAARSLTVMRKAVCPTGANSGDGT